MSSDRDLFPVVDQLLKDAGAEQIGGDGADKFRQDVAEQLKIICQSALDRDPRSASNGDPLERRVLAVALAPSELAGVAETARARVGL